VDTTYKLCTNCTLLVVSGDFPTDTTPEQDDRIQAGMNRLGWLMADFNTDSTEGIDFISTKPCECCEDVLHGYRYRFTTMDSVGGCDALPD